MKILHLIDTLDGDASSRQLQLLIAQVACEGCHIEICCIGPTGAQAAAIAERGIRVHVLGWTRWLDGRALWRLRDLVRGGGFDLVHVWQLAALRKLALVAADTLPRAIISSALAASDELAWWDRQLLQRVRCLVLAGDDERERCTLHGLGTLPWRVIPTAAAPKRCADVPTWALQYPRRIACAGPLVRRNGFREAIWAVDILRYVFPDIHLLIAGEGPFRTDLQAMIEKLKIDNAHLLGDAMDPAEVLAAGHVCWVPSPTIAGQQAALEAMALGRPVVAAAGPAMRMLFRDGEAGCLVPAGDPVALARQTRALLADPGLCARLGAAAQAEAAARFALPHIAARWRALYNEMAA